MTAIKRIVFGTGPGLPVCRCGGGSSVCMHPSKWCAPAVCEVGLWQVCFVLYLHPGVCVYTVCVCVCVCVCVLLQWSACVCVCVAVGLHFVPSLGGALAGFLVCCRIYQRLHSCDT